MNYKKIRKILSNLKYKLLKVFNIFPLKNYIIFESNPDFNDEAYWICEKFIKENDGKFKIVWIVQDRNLTNKPISWNDVDFIYWYPKKFGDWFKKWYIWSTASVIFDTCNFVPKMRKKQFRIFDLHGMPIKKIDGYISSIGEFDYFNIGSSFEKDYYTKIGFNGNKLISLGLARNDQLCKPEGKFRKYYNIPLNSKMILWMPTYRQHITNNQSISIDQRVKNASGIPVLNSKEEFETINSFLKQNDAFLVLKIHPSQRTDIIKVDQFSNILIIETQDLYDMKSQLYEIIGEFDALITDYSSIYFDYLLLDRPIAITTDDLNEYKTKIGFVFDDFYSTIKGVYISNLTELMNYIGRVASDDASLLDCIEGCKEQFNDYTDFQSTDRLYKFIMENFK